MQGKKEQAATLKKTIKHEILKNRKNHILAKLEFDPKEGHKWKAIKQLRKKYTPNYTKIKDIRGNILGLGKRAEGMAEHLREVQWKNHIILPSERTPDTASSNASYPSGTHSAYPQGTHSSYPSGTHSAYPEGTHSANPQGTHSTHPEGTNMSDKQMPTPPQEPPPTPHRRSQEQESTYNTGPFTRRELEEAFDKQKNNKAPGPDEIKMEYIKWLNTETKTEILNIINECFREGKTIGQMDTATIISMFKKGDTQNLGNYRPIALLNAIYKLYAAMLKVRIEEGTERHLQKTQYGFRKGRSTTQALFIARRLQDLAEQDRSNLIMIFLDWEKAFDKIDQRKLLEAMRKIGIPEQLVKAAQGIYKNPKFKVRFKNESSETYRQETGIRQGCPLSPYLFLIVMTVLFQEVYEEEREARDKGHVKEIDFNEILFADDTLLVARNTETITRILHKIELKSQEYNMKLNKDKCIALTMYKENRIKFSNGQKVPKAHAATYLGAQIAKNVNIRLEVNKRITAAAITANQLKLVWGKAQIPTKWKILSYNSIVLSQLIYGLETTQLTTAMEKKLDAFHIKGIRRILKWEPTAYNRENTNEKLLMEAEKQTGKRIKLASEIIRNKKLALLGHVVRADESDPMRQATLKKGEIIHLAPEKRRVGRPRAKWVEETARDAWEKLGYKTDYLATTRQQQKIKAAILERTAPFEGSDAPSKKRRTTEDHPPIQ